MLFKTRINLHLNKLDENIFIHIIIQVTNLKYKKKYFLNMPNLSKHLVQSTSDSFVLQKYGNINQ